MRVEVCAHVQKIEQWHVDSDLINLAPWRVTFQIESILTGTANDLLKVGTVLYSRVHSPAITFGASLDEIQGKRVRILLLNKSEEWILEKGTIDPSCVPIGSN